MTRDSKGRFIKGSKGIGGRPKKVKLSAEVSKEIIKLKTVNEKVDYLINFLLDNATEKSEIFKMVKELLPYIKPKLRNIETKEEIITKMEISWVDGNDKLIDVTSKNDEDE